MIVSKTVTEGAKQGLIKAQTAESDSRSWINELNREIIEATKDDVVRLAEYRADHVKFEEAMRKTEVDIKAALANWELRTGGTYVGKLGTSIGDRLRKLF